MKKMIIPLMLLILLICPAYAATIKLIMAFHKNDTVYYDKIRLAPYEATPLVQYDNIGEEYLIKAIDKHNETLKQEILYIEFMLQSDPPLQVDYSEFEYEIPYNQTLHKIQVEHNNRVIYSKEIPNYCNMNGKCDGNDTYFTCPQDCEPWAKDEWCNNARDRHCDTDCGLDDEDCAPAHMSIRIYAEDDDAVKETTVTIVSSKETKKLITNKEGIVTLDLSVDPATENITITAAKTGYLVAEETIRRTTPNEIIDYAIKLQKDPNYKEPTPTTGIVTAALIGTLALAVAVIITKRKRR